MAGGRPLKFGSPQEIIDKGIAYIQSQHDQKLPVTITGLCIALGTFRDVLMDYQDERGEEFSNAVKALKLYCENYAEEQIFIGKNPAGAIFALKNYGWKDKNDVAHTDGEGKPLNMSPVVNILGYKDFNPQINATTGPQDMVEGFQRSPLNERDSAES